MDVTFGLELDGGSWPGPIGDGRDGRDACVGEAWVGPLGLLGLLEPQLGLGGLRPSAALRVVSLVPHVRSIDGFWSASARVDPIGVARELLRWRDELMLHGWDGQPIAAAPRIAQLAQVTADTEPGLPDRLRACIDLCRERVAPGRTGPTGPTGPTEASESPGPSGSTGLPAVPPIRRLRLVGCAIDELPALWRTLLDVLAAGGTVVEAADAASLEAMPLEAAPPERGAVDGPCDLRSCLRADFEPRGDGSLQLVRAAGPFAAAEQVAAWLAARRDRDGRGALDHTVIIGGDAVLDAALHRFGLPPLGAAAPCADHPALQILPLVLELGWTPQDPNLALRLLDLEPSPVPRSLRGHLRKALHDWPAVDSDRWREELASGLEKIESVARRKRVAERLATIFRGAVELDAPYPVEELRARAAMLAAWLQARRTLAEEDAPAGPAAGVGADGPGSGGLVEILGAATGQADALLHLVEAGRFETLTRRQLGQLLRAATAEARLEPRCRAGAGLLGLADPAAIIAPVRCVVWWGFTSAAPSAQLPRPQPLDRSELAALAGAGVMPPEPGTLAERRGRAWRRPFALAEEALLLACPEMLDDEHPTAPHPAWDEVVATLDDTRRSRLERTEPRDAPRTRTLTPLPLPARAREWTLPPGVAVPAPASFSPTSAGDLVGCPALWLAKRHGRLRYGAARRLPTGVLLMGLLVHKVLEHVIGGAGERDALAPEALARRAADHFDREGARLAAEYFMPQAQRTRLELRTITTEAARGIGHCLERTGARVVGLEQELKGAVHGLRIEGRADVLLADPAAVLDLKWGRSRDRHDELAQGGAFQLALYAQLAADGGPLPAIGYYIVSRGELMTNAQGALLGGNPVDGPSPAETCAAFAAAVARRLDELSRGHVDVTAIEIEETWREKSRTEDGLAIAQPPCRYCECAFLCGRGFA